MNEIAIVGLSCRLPGASSPDEFWALLRDGKEGIGEAPADRAPGITRGGFLDDVEGFDEGFFRISPREAAAMDPQQRLALELGWEGLEDAALGREPGTVGVFVGVMGSDYGHVLAAAGPDAVGHHTMPGQGRALIANRISYALGLAGPSLTVDTGQSSSLVAVHLACQSLRESECEVALAGGVNLILSPLSSRATIEFGALSPDGRCYAWDERANGHVRGEGGGIVVLKRLRDALDAGDRIYGVIRGSGLSTGSGESGLTVPSAEAQRAAIGAALARARVDAHDVQYVELHGTGTPVGDPIEASAIAEAYGRDRTDRLAVGSVKTNLGHLEGAAGIAGLIKTVLCVYHGQLVASLHFERPNPKIALDELNLRVAQHTEAWPGAPRRAGVSAFGMGGANCHVVLEEPPPVERSETSVGPVTLSAYDRAGLVAQARQLRTFVAEHEPDLADLGFSLATGRTHLGERAAVVADDLAGLLTGLDALVAGGSHERLLDATARSGRTVFVFPGQGSQWEGMAAELLETSPVFAASVEACETALAPHVDWSLRDVLTKRGPSLDRVDVVQPALWAVMVSLAALWRSHGIEPGAVIGHSQGEIAAAYVAGALTLEDAARVVALRSQAIAEGLAGQGGMASIALDVDSLQLPDGLSVAAVNGPRSVVVAGEDEALDALLETLAAEGVWVRRVPVDYPSHSAAVERLEQRLLADLGPIAPVSGDIPFYSTLEGEPIDTAALDATYWYRNLRNPVRFAPTVKRLLEDGAGVFIEPSPHPVLVNAVAETIEQAGASAAAIGTLRRDDGCLERFTCALANAHVHGAPVDWTTVFAGGRRVSLPPYTFQRRRHWLDAAGGTTGDLRAAGLEAATHPLLAATLRLPHAGQTVFTGRLVATAGHAVLESTLAPAGTLVELALHAGAQVGAPTLDALTLHAPVALPADVQVAVGDRDRDGRHAVNLHAREDDGAWRSVADGVLSDLGTADVPPELWPPPAATPIDVEALHDRLAERGLTPSPALRAAWTRGDALFAEAAVDEAHEYALHPALLEAALQLEIDRRPPGPWVAAALSAVTVVRPGAQAVRMHVAAGRIDAHDTHGELVFTVTAELREHDPDTLRELRWTELPTGDERPAHLVVLRRAVGVLDTDVPDLAAAAMWGRLRAEQPGDFVLVDTDGPSDRVGPLPGGEPQLALRGGRAYAPRLAPAGVQGGRPALQGTVLVTGAGAPAGAGVARRLATRAAVNRLLLLGAPPALIEELGDIAIAIAERDLDTALVHEPELQAVIHTTLDVRLAERLDGRTAGRELAAFVCFTASTLGECDSDSAGASAALEALAARRRARGLPGQVLEWERSPEGALDLFERALRLDAPHLVIARENIAALPDTPLLADLRPVKTFARRVGALPEAERPALVLDVVREHTAAVLQHATPDAIEPDRRFKDLGMDSITAVALRDRLVQATGVALPTTLIFDHPSCAAVTRVLLRAVAPEPDPVAAPADDERVTAIDAMDVDDLIRMTYAMES